MLAPTLAEQARTAVSVIRVASLATVDSDGRPVVGPAPIIDDGSGQPVTVLSNLTTHTLRARRDARAAMGIGERLLIQGTLDPVPGLQQLELQGRFVASHPSLARQVESLDYSWFRLRVERLRWIDDSGTEHWLRPEDLFGAEPDPLAHLDDTDIADVAERLDDDLLVIVRSLGGRWLARSAELRTIDRYGIVTWVDEPGRQSLARVPFPVRLDEATEMHAALAAIRSAALAAPSDGSRPRGGPPAEPEPVPGAVPTRGADQARRAAPIA